MGSPRASDSRPKLPLREGNRKHDWADMDVAAAVDDALEDGAEPDEADEVEELGEADDCGGRRHRTSGAGGARGSRRRVPVRATAKSKAKAKAQGKQKVAKVTGNCFAAGCIEKM